MSALALMPGTEQVPRKIIDFVFLMITFPTAVQGDTGWDSRGSHHVGVFCPTPYVSELCLGPLYHLSA